LRTHRKLSFFTIKVLICFLYLNATHAFSNPINNQQISLIPEETLTENTLVTVGIPFAPGQLSTTNNLRIYNEQGEDVAIFVKPTLFWHWKPVNENTIRAVKVQFYLAQGSEEKNYSFSFDSPRNLTSDLSEIDYNLGTKVSTDPLKANMRHPIVFSIVDTVWLEQSQIIPPFIGINTDNHEEFWEKEFEWGSKLDFTQRNIAHWLFDRVTALYKNCMRTSDSECYKEAFLSYQFWNTNIRREGGLLECRGGLDISSVVNKACDNKYIYTEPFKIHLALTGDDSSYSEQLVRDMAELVYNNNWQGASYDLYDQENEVFTERHTGLTLLTLVNAYELVGGQEILTRINEHIESLYQHQNNNPDGLASDGTFRHSWTQHEGATYPGDGTMDDRRFSPWMTENIMDALWQSHFIVGDSRISEMIRYAGEGLNNWGFANSQGYIDKFGTDLHSVIGGQSWRLSCNRGGDLVLYSGSATASSDALIHTQNGDGWYSDTHIPETIFSLAVAYYFETDPVKAQLLKNRLTGFDEKFIKNCGGQLFRTKRAFNWSNRSNYWGTYLWVLEQKGEALPIVTEADEYYPPNPSPTEPEPEEEPVPEELINYVNTFTDVFDDTLSDAWQLNAQWLLAEMGLQSNEGYNRFLLDESIDAGEQYRVEMNIILDESHTSDKHIILGNETDTFYTVRMKAGQFGGVYLYKHIASWDNGGQVLASKTRGNLLSDTYKLVAVVNGSNIKVYLDNDLQFEFDNESIFTGVNNGIFAQGSSAVIDSFLIEYERVAEGPSFDNTLLFDFTTLDTELWQESSWIVNAQTVTTTTASLLVLEETIDLGNSYVLDASMDMNTESRYGINLLFNNTNDEFYTARIYSGPWGGVYLYKHSSIWDLGGTPVETQLMPMLADTYNFKVIAQGTTANIYVNDELVITYEFDEPITGQNVGLHSLGNISNLGFDELTISY